MTNKKSNSDPSGHGETLERLGMMAIVGVVALIITPLAIMAFVGGYFLYWAWYSKPERKILRTGLMIIMVFMGFGLIRDLMLYCYFDSIAQFWLRFFNPDRRTSITFNHLRSAITTYCVLLPLGLSPAAAWFMKYKNWDVMRGPYDAVKGAMEVAASPFEKLIIFLGENGVRLWVLLVTMVGGTLGLMMYWKLLIKMFPHSSFIQILYMDHARSPIVVMYTLISGYVFFRRLGELEKEQEAPVDGSAKLDEVSPLEIGKIKGKHTKLGLTWKDLNHHIHVLGQPGSGKSSLLKHVYEHQIKNGAGLMIVDLKADQDAFHEVVGLCQNAGRLQDLQVIDLKRPDQSCGYNPLLRGSASELKDKIIGSLEWSEIYYKKVAERFMLNIMRGLVAIRDKHIAEIPTLADVLDATSKPMAIETLSAQVPENMTEIRSDLRAMALELKNRDTFEALSGLRTDLEVLVKSEFGDILSSERSIDLLDSIQNRKIIYVLLDGQTFGSLALRVGRMLLADLRAASGSIVSTTGREERPRFSVVIDEFSDLVSAKETGQLFTGFLNRCRGSGLGVIIAHQSLGDFEDKQVMKQVLDSTETLFSFVQKDPESCEILSGIAGTKEVWQKTEQVNSTFLFGDDATGAGTRKKVHEFIYHPNDFKNLNTGEAIYIAKKPSRHGQVVIDFKRIPLVPINMGIEGQINKTPENPAPLFDLRGKVLRATQALTAKPDTTSEVSRQELI